MKFAKFGYGILAVIALLFSQSCTKENLLPANTSAFGKVLYTEHQYFFTANQVDSILLDLDPFVGQLLNPIYDIDVYKIHYHTRDHHGKPTYASGVIVVPQVPVGTELPLMSYQHGTILAKSNVASQSFGGELILGLYCASDGYMMAMPDMLGLGDGPGFHPYMHARSEATAVIDMLRATRNFAETQNVLLDGKLFLLGYSQGGHSTMAAAREIQLFYSNEFTITACAPMAGPYDASGVQAEVITQDQAYPTPGYLPYVLYSYNMVYEMYPDTRDVILDTWDAVIHPRMDGLTSMGALNNLCPNIPNRILEPQILDDFRNQPDHIMRQALRDNDLYDWTPQFPLTMYYCEGDDQVTYENSIVAYDAFRARGAKLVFLYNVDNNLNHSDCALPALINGKGWFDNFR